MASEPIEYSDDYEEAPVRPVRRYEGAGGEEEPRRARSHAAVWIATLLSIVWIGLAAAAIWLLLQGAPLTEIALTEWSAISAGLFAPLAAIWLAALVIARVDPGRGRERIAALEAAEAKFDASAARIEARLDGLGTELEQLGARTEEAGQRLADESAGFERMTLTTVEHARAMSIGLAEDRERIEALINQLGERASLLHRTMEMMQERLPAFAEDVERIQTGLDTGGAQSEERAERLLALLQEFEARNNEAARQAVERAGDADRLLAHMDRTVQDVEAQMNERRGDLANAAEAALGNLSAVLDTLKDSLARETERVRHVVAETHGLLEHGAIQSADMLEDRLTRLRGDVAQMDDGMRRILARLDEGLTQTSGRAGELEERFEAASGRGLDVADRLEARLSVLGEKSESALAPLADLGGHVDRTTDALAQIETVAGRIGRDLAGPLADQTTRTTGNFEALSAAVSEVVVDIERLAMAADALPDNVEAMRNGIAGAVGDVDEARGGLEAATERLTQGLSGARDELSGIRGEIDDVSSGSAERLIEVLGRVREVAKQASGSVRETFDAAVEDAIASLERASGETVTRTVTGPVQVEIERLGETSQRSAEAAQASAERLSRSLVSVAETAAALEARIQDANTHIDTALKADLGEQSNLLMEALNSSAIDITKLMSADVTEASWKQYLAGDRSVFTRRASRLIENRDAKQIAQLYESEPEFRDAARSYIHDFEAMLRRVMSDRQGNSLSVALLSSDVGRLYVALNEAVSRD